MSTAVVRNIKIILATVIILTVAVVTSSIMVQLLRFAWGKS